MYFKFEKMYKKYLIFLKVYYNNINYDLYLKIIFHYFPFDNCSEGGGFNICGVCYFWWNFIDGE